MSEESQKTSHASPASSPGAVQMPDSAGWPMIAAFAITLTAAGLVTNFIVSVIGLITLVVSCVGWFREVLPHEAHKPVPIEPEPEYAARPVTKVSRLEVGQLGHRTRLPLEIYPYRAGIWGGLAGGAAMAVTAILYGVLKHGSVWYPINLLAAAGSAEVSAMTYEQLRVFDMTAFVLALVIHAVSSALIGLLYGIALPMFPRRPMLLGGILAPLFWSGILHSTLLVINPALENRIDWWWFMASQFAFGIVAGFVVTKHTKIATMQHLPIALRAGIETPGLLHERSTPDEPEGGGHP